MWLSFVSWNLLKSLECLHALEEMQYSSVVVMRPPCCPCIYLLPAIGSSTRGKVFGVLPICSLLISKFIFVLFLSFTSEECLLPTFVIGYLSGSWCVEERPRPRITLIWSIGFRPATFLSSVLTEVSFLIKDLDHESLGNPSSPDPRGFRRPTRKPSISSCLESGIVGFLCSSA